MGPGIVLCASLVPVLKYTYVYDVYVFFNLHLFKSTVYDLMLHILLYDLTLYTLYYVYTSTSDSSTCSKATGVYLLISALLSSGI